MLKSISLLFLLLLVPACGGGAEDPQNPGAEKATDSTGQSQESIPEASGSQPVPDPEPEEPSDQAGADHPEPEEAPVVDGEGLILGSDGKRHAGTLEDPVPIDIDFLGAWTFEESDNPFPEHCLAIQGKVVKIRGFMLPDVDFENITRFHLVRSLWGCCFGAPPRINEIVRVTVADGKGVDYTYNTLEIVGTIEVIFEIQDGLIEDLYRLTAVQIEEKDFDDPLAPDEFDPSTGFKGVVPEPSF
ncbi:MAG: DUF3299 domain-containing protein [Planctomycetota bacterium]|nr:MAG: DUF3299 domain-containing protein [Planctomycetota bacterium]